MLDQTVERNKNLRDAHIVENWIRKSHDILEKCELDPLPDSFLHETVPSETGTDYSVAMTSEHVQHDQVLLAASVLLGRSYTSITSRLSFSCSYARGFFLCSSLQKQKTKFRHLNLHLGV